MEHGAIDASARSFLKWFMGVIGFGLLAIAGFVALVDPYGVIGLTSIPGFNTEKRVRMDKGGRVERSLRLWMGRYDTILLGSSRLLMGINPSGPTLASHRAFIAGVSKTNMAEIYRIGRFVLEHQSPDRLIFGLDFHTFSSRREFRGDFRLSGFAGEPMTHVLGRSLISFSTVLDALVTVRTNAVGVRSATHPDGHFVFSGNYDYRERFDEVLRNFMGNPETYGGYDYDRGRTELVEDLLRRFAAAGTGIYVFISPIHAKQIEALAALGLYPTFERWKRDVTAVVDRVNASLATDRKIELWDFSGYNAITTEPVPSNDKKQVMKWYWESSHYKPAVGEMLLARVLGENPSGLRIPEDFGVRLTGETIESVLAAMRERQSRYRSEFREEVADISRLMRQTAKVRTVCCN